MTRLSYVDLNQLPDEWRRLFDELERERGFVPNLYRAMAHSPRLLDQFLDMGAAMRAPGALPASLRELAILRVAALTGAETMRISHLPAARESGLTEEILAAVTAGAALSELHERAVVRFVDEVTRDVGASDATWTAVAQFLNEEQLVELTLLTGFYNMVARILRTVAIDLDPRYEDGA